MFGDSPIQRWEGAENVTDRPVAPSGPQWEFWRALIRVLPVRKYKRRGQTRILCARLLAVATVLYG